MKSYPITMHGVSVQVTIDADRYALALPTMEAPTRALLDDIKKGLVASGKVGVDDDPARMLKTIAAAIRTNLPTDTGAQPLLAITLHNEMTGLGDIEYILNDPYLEEITVHASAVMVFHKDVGWLRTDLPPLTEEQVQNYANIIGRRVGREISLLYPVLDARMASGDRANAVLSPISNTGNTLTIRKFAREPWTVVDFIRNKTCSSDVFALIWLALQYEMNILFSGGTASGKTSMLNVCMPFIPPNQRIISIEDTRELQLPAFLFWEPLVTRLANPEGKGEVSMLDLLVNSLRMRPDRIVLGEVRRGEDALVLFEAMHTGHSVYATVHANTMHETIQRLINPPISVPPRLLGAVNLNVVMFRDRRLGIRRVLQVGEYTQEKEDNTPPKPNVLYRWSATDDTIVQHAKSQKLFDEIARHTSLSEGDIENELRNRKMILEWLVNNGVSGIRNIGAIMERYYRAPQAVVAAAQKNTTPGALLG